MSNKGFIILISVLVIGAFGFIAINKKSTPKELILGTQHANLGQEHIAEGKKHSAYNSDLPSSGPHRSDSGAPVPWGVYTQELTPEVYIHNEEHGGIIIAYNPTLLPAQELKKLQSLFAPPYSNKLFSPTKTIVMPRASNKHAIEVASWTWTYSMDKYDEAKLIKFYRQHEGKSPEAAAGPTNTPINQAANQQ